MNTNTTISSASDLARAKTSLATRVAQALQDADGGSCVEPHAVRLEVPIDGLSPLSWFQAQDCALKTYWSSREGEFEMAGIGAADQVRGDSAAELDRLVEHIQTRLTGSAAGSRYYGGMRFDASPGGDTRWEPFGTSAFVLPRFEVVRLEESVVLACNLVLGTDKPENAAAILAELSAMRAPSADDSQGLPVLAGRQDLPDRAGWLDGVEEVLNALRDGGLEKVVLARESQLSFDGSVEPVELLRRLLPRTPHCYHFCFQPSQGAAFLGATPERLYTRTGRRLESDAVAGTRPRGKGVEDDALREELLSSDKERREHAFVVRAIEEGLRRLCATVRAPDPVSILKLRTCQHLFARLGGVLRAGVSDAEICRELHPTPAVGGYPTARALDWLREHEPFDRGWYGGPVGFIGRDEAEFAVAIRSGLVQNDALSLYSGAGIVRGSEPEAEWAEIENKLAPLMGALPSNHGS
jgi:menaquinone-specific isochorismate synthase